MPKHLIVDGYNVIRRDPALSSLEQREFVRAQEALIRLLAEYRRGTQHRVTVVFDGRNSDNWLRSRGHRQGVDIVYSARGETADDVIREFTDRAAAAPGVLVATADRELARACQQQGAGVVAPEMLTRRARPRPAPAAGAEASLGKREETGWSGHTRKRGNPRRRPKQQRRPQGLW